MHELFRTGNRTLSLLFLILLIIDLHRPTVARAETVDETHPATVAEGWLGDPIELDFNAREKSPFASQRLRPHGPLITPVNPFDRLSVVDFYQCAYVPSIDYLTTIDWTGDTTTCTAGTVSQAFQDDTLRRINYYRAMTGLNADITFNATKNVKAQEAALIMSRNCGLSHAPIMEFPDWACLSTDGNEAAGVSNLSLGISVSHTGPDAIDGQMRDAGQFNTPVGHRRWLLYPPSVEMGNGGIPNRTQCSASVVWVIGDSGTRPLTPEWVSWPTRVLCPITWSSIDGHSRSLGPISMALQSQ